MSPGDSQPASKRLKVDTDEQVSQLFAASQANSAELLKKKRLVFKLVQQMKDASAQVRVDDLWKKILSLPESQNQDKDTKKPIIESKQDLVRSINSLEQDNCVMYIVEEGKVVLI